MRRIPDASAHLTWVFIGDLEDTRCASCRTTLIARVGYHIRDYRLTRNGCCPACGAAVPGRWSEAFEGQIASRPFLPGSRSRLAVLHTKP